MFYPKESIWAIPKNTAFSIIINSRGSIAILLRSRNSGIRAKVANADNYPKGASNYDITSIVVTHSLDEGLLKQYDGIITLKNGSIVETGTVDELIAEKGYFYSLFTISQ